MPFNTIKIDKSFIDNIEENDKGVEIVKTIIAMGHNLKMNVIAEGVETEKQLKILKDLKCDGVQGYYYSRPVPADEMTKSYS